MVALATPRYSKCMQSEFAMPILSKLKQLNHSPSTKSATAGKFITENTRSGANRWDHCDKIKAVKSLYLAKIFKIFFCKIFFVNPWENQVTFFCFWMWLNHIGVNIYKKQQFFLFLNCQFKSC